MLKSKDPAQISLDSRILKWYWQQSDGNAADDVVERHDYQFWNTGGKERWNKDFNIWFAGWP